VHQPPDPALKPLFRIRAAISGLVWWYKVITLPLLDELVKAPSAAALMPSSDDEPFTAVVLVDIA